MNGYPSRSPTDGFIQTQKNLGNASDDLSRDSVRGNGTLQVSSGCVTSWCRHSDCTVLVVFRTRTRPVAGERAARYDDDASILLALRGTGNQADHSGSSLLDH